MVENGFFFFFFKITSNLQGKEWHKNFMVLRVRRKVVSCSTWMFETIPGKKPHWRSIKKAKQRISNYYQIVSKLKVLCLMLVSQSSKLFTYSLSKRSNYFRAWKRKESAPNLWLTSPLNCLFSTMFSRNRIIMWGTL